MKQNICHIFFLFLPWWFFGQSDTIHRLEEVVLSDARLYFSSSGNRVQVLNDSVIQQNAASLTDLLKFNTPLFFKENGAGMVASPAFRGTTASQTAVIWNGININSSLTGQVDFNTILSSNYDEISLRSGGGSVLYGSGAIGGSVHLVNRFAFNKGLMHQLDLEGGSFHTGLGRYRGSYSSEKTSAQLSLIHSSSQNNFPYPDSNQKNQNGDFRRIGASASVAHILDDRNTLSFYTNSFYGHRGFSGTLTLPSRSKYEDRNSRSLLEWSSEAGRFSSKLRAAYLLESYAYFEDRYRSDRTSGETRTGILKYDLGYRIGPGMKLSGILEGRYTSGEGTHIGEQRRRRASMGLLWEHRLDRFIYEVGIREEISDAYDSPLLVNLGAGYSFSPAYQVQMNVSRNYRIPTFNDLFWYAGGDTSLEPETSLQAELTQRIHLGDLEMRLTGFLVEVNQLLRWVPSSSGLWEPENTEEVRNAGVEVLFNWKKVVNKQTFSLSGTYAFTESRDLVLDRSLIYVPKHKATGSLGYQRGRLQTFLQYLYSGSVFTSSDNAYWLDDYWLTNLGISYRLFPWVEGGLILRNIFDHAYMSMPSRPMPGRAVTGKLTFKL